MTTNPKKSIIGDITYEIAKSGNKNCIRPVPDRYHDNFPAVLQTSKKFTRKAVIRLVNKTGLTLKFTIDQPSQDAFKGKNGHLKEFDLAASGPDSEAELELYPKIGAKSPPDPGRRLSWHLVKHSSGIEICPHKSPPTDHSEVIIEC